MKCLEKAAGPQRAEGLGGAEALSEHEQLFQRPQTVHRNSDIHPSTDCDYNSKYPLFSDYFFIEVVQNLKIQKTFWGEGVF